MNLTHQQVQALLQPVHPARVKKVQGQSHLEAWDVRRHLIRAFGFGGWDFERLSCELVHNWSGPCKNKAGKEYTGHTVIYRVEARLVIKSADGTVIAHYDDAATGDSVNQPSLGDAHDMALKTAYSQALKRCAMNLGDAFGLSLYDNGSTRAVVVRTCVDDPGEQEAGPVAEPDEAVADPESEPEMEDPSRYAAQIAAAERPDVLAAVGTNIATAQLAPAARQALRDQFSSRMTQLKAAAAA